jgi:hypothetical protein
MDMILVNDYITLGYKDLQLLAIYNANGEPISSGIDMAEICFPIARIYTYYLF